MEYYYDSGEVNDMVSYRVLDENGKILHNRSNSICFATLFQRKLPKGADKVVFYKDLYEIPYNKNIIRKWIKLIDSFGFPCEVSFEGDTCNIIFDVKKYKYRPQLLSALSLARCLTETSICYIPSYFFTKLRQNPKTDKFSLLLKAHFEISNNCNLYGWPNTHHMVTYNGKRPLILKTLFTNFKNHEKAKLFSNGFCGIESCW